MIFLIIKILVYLLVAAGIGGAAGWLLRNLQAQRAEEHANRAMNDAKSKLPQLESLLRGRDDQLKKLQEEVGEARAQVTGHINQIKGHEQKIREQERELSRFQQSAQARTQDGVNDMDYETVDGSETDSLITDLSQEIARLKQQLETQGGAGHSAAPSAAARTGMSEEESLLRIELDALQLQHNAIAKSLDRTQVDLRTEQDKVRELERERELQNKSIQVLHQQLEMERSRRAANG